MVEIIKKRTLSVLGPAGTDADAQAWAVLAAMEGVRHIKHVGPGKLAVEYDLTTISRRAIELKLRAHGLSLPDGLLPRWKRSWVDFMESNEYSNMTAKPSPCCSNPKGIVQTDKKH